MTYIRVDEKMYPATIVGRVGDNTGDGRESKSITLTMSHDEVAALLPDGTPWSIVQRTPAPDESGTENENEWDNSAFSLSGDITDHRDGTVTIKMGKPTDLEDAYEMLPGGDEA